MAGCGDVRATVNMVHKTDRSSGATAMGGHDRRALQPVPIILDDALVRLDDDRIEPMFDALEPRRPKTAGNRADMRPRLHGTWRPSTIDSVEGWVVSLRLRRHLSV